MEYLTGVAKKETLEISELLAGDLAGQKVKVNGAVHTIRDMGTVAFVVLRKREGLLQGVYEEGIAGFDLKDLREADAVEIEGTLEKNEKAPNGIETVSYTHLAAMIVSISTIFARNGIGCPILAAHAIVCLVAIALITNGKVNAA